MYSYLQIHSYLVAAFQLPFSISLFPINSICYFCYCKSQVAFTVVSDQRGTQVNPGNTGNANNHKATHCSINYNNINMRINPEDTLGGQLFPGPLGLTLVQHSVAHLGHLSQAQQGWSPSLICLEKRISKCIRNVRLSVVLLKATSSKLATLLEARKH